MSEEKIYDIIIAGAGLSGVLAANRLCQSLGDVSILLLEKESSPGGRAAVSSEENKKWGLGLHFQSAKLLDFCEHSFSLDPDIKSPEDLYASPLKMAAVLSAGKFSEFPMNDFFGQRAAKAFGGSGVVKQWEYGQKLLLNSEESEKDNPLAKLWHEPKKSTAVSAWKQLMGACGITDLWHASSQALNERAMYMQAGLYSSNWNSLINSLLSLPKVSEKLSQNYNCQILGASKKEDLWEIHTEKGTFKSRSLLVSQAPWLAMNWLDRNHCPQPMLQLALKTKPTSSVTLSLEADKSSFPWDMVFIPAEDVCCVHNGEKTLCFQANIDYELSLDAPSVVKAIKRLKRARKKLEKALPDLDGKKDHLALTPVAWAQSANFQEKKIAESLNLESKLQSEELSFCGDSYGTSFNPDENTLKSLLSACETISLRFKDKKED